MYDDELDDNDLLRLVNDVVVRVCVCVCVCVCVQCADASSYTNPCTSRSVENIAKEFCSVLLSHPFTDCHSSVSRLVAHSRKFT